MMCRTDLYLIECKLSDLILQDRVIATEFLTDSVFTQVKDLTHRMLTGITSVLTDPYKPTELKAFLSQYRTQYTAYTAQPLAPIPSVPVPIPAGMKYTYAITAGRLHDHLYMGDVNIPSVIQSLNMALGAVTVLNARDSASDRDRLQKAYIAAHTQLTQCSKILTTLTVDLFDPASTLNTALAPDQFPNRRQLKLTTDSVRSMGDIYTTSERLIHQINQTFSKSTETLNAIHGNRTHLTRDDMLMFAFVLNKSAQIFRLYGIVLMLVQQVEHSYTQALRTLIVPGR